MVQTADQPAIGLARRHAQIPSVFVQFGQYSRHAVIKRLIDQAIVAQVEESASVMFGQLIMGFVIGIGQQHPHRFHQRQTNHAPYILPQRRRAPRTLKRMLHRHTDIGLTIDQSPVAIKYGEFHRHGRLRIKSAISRLPARSAPSAAALRTASGLFCPSLDVPRHAVMSI